MPFRYERVIRFHETDAAGVVYFANVLTLCHEAYEASLGAAGFNLRLFFSKEGGMAVPIVHTESDFYQPLRCGDTIDLCLTPRQLNPDSFEISYQLYRQDRTTENTSQTEKAVVRALTRHTCINPQTHHRQPLPPELADWIASLAETKALSD